ncbi:putative lipid II flippase FtsW [Azoarcus communis]|uniref:Probable peptidoglycan glycosyltransferase FtsW n=1 Tax=Parazoarcus communis SWub3 = DSM 12120 TaxID=1121029 RepID=A0A323V1C2_9RHOO|nr:putative lipid II flippase FtsW [Parazoarcus communis]NMG47339.1 putative lipid II flippase FtsW [Parazoarcus communis]NMG70149.1 putative lipid II flippase FtsW [Parazoarcus communis SWub3 = DSM 12120]PZA18321.1 putative lipid II flippase FtsW [Azoarcus communis] [Parazoarcus communis SWub3 = DSM 12120]
MKLAATFSSLFAKRTAAPAARSAARLARNAEPARELDLLLIWSAVGLLLLGLVMVYSASIAFAEGSRFTGYQSHYFLMRHAVFLAVGVGLGLVAFQLPMTQWQRLAPALFVGGVVLLVVVLIPGVGREVNGAQRWLSLGPVNLQPSELMKIFAALYAADYTVRKLDAMSSFKRGFLPMMIVILFVGFLLLREPDFGAFVVITSIAFGVLFLGGVNIRVFALLGVFALIGFVILIWTSPYRRERIFGFMDPWQDAFGKGYQLSHALIAFGRGEWFGVGLGGSVEKLFYLPEAHTDFLLAVIAEELGFVGVLTVVLLFALLVQRAFAIGRDAIRLERYFPGLVAQGIGLWIGVQSFINMGVNTGLLPTKGLTLPLMSFGGSGIVANCLALAILLRVDWENRQIMRGGRT